mmetsp:Transcript_27863/g.50797  ORF Transcript_27863/g.50797 Transcript_27863/m.50797 type:complete len:208 (-) Transcript_27863:863-1486(-)
MFVHISRGWDCICHVDHHFSPVFFHFVIVRGWKGRSYLKIGVFRRMFRVRSYYIILIGRRRRWRRRRSSMTLEYTIEGTILQGIHRARRMRHLVERGLDVPQSNRLGYHRVTKGGALPGTFDGCRHPYRILHGLRPLRRDERIRPSSGRNGIGIVGFDALGKLAGAGGVQHARRFGTICRDVLDVVQLTRQVGDHSGINVFFLHEID